MAHWADARGPAGGRGPAAAGPAMLHACIVIGLTIDFFCHHRFFACSIGKT
jgi:hypothetical protein